MNSIKIDYHKKGFVKIESLFSVEEINLVNSEINRLLKSNILSENNLRTVFKASQSSTVFLEKIDPIIDISLPISRIANDSRIVDICKELLNDDVYLFKDMAVLKEPNADGFELHQDYAWWQPVDSNNFKILNPSKIISVVISINEATEMNGPIIFYPSLHSSLITTKGEKRNFNNSEKNSLIQKSKYVGLMKQGDVIFFHSLIPHYSDKNLSSTSRRQLVLTFNSKSEGNLYEAQLLNYIDIQHKRAELKGITKKQLI